MYSHHPPRGEGMRARQESRADDAALPFAPSGPGVWSPTGPDGPGPHAGAGPAAPLLPGAAAVDCREDRREGEAGAGRWGDGRQEREFEGFESRGREAQSFIEHARREEEDVFRNDRTDRGASVSVGADAAVASGREARREEKKRKAGREKGARKENVAWVVSVYTVVVLLLFLGCAISGVFLGIIVTSPTVRIATTSLHLSGQLNPTEADVYGNPSVWHFRVNSVGKLEMGGDVTFVLPLLNPSIFTLEFVVENLSVFYYPIGKSFQCLLYHGGIIGNEGQPLFLHRELIAEPANGNSSRYISPLSMTVKPTDGSISDDATFRIQTTFGVELPEAYLPEAKPLFDDCRQHGVLIYAVEVSGAYTDSPLTQVKMPGPIEVVAALNCSIGRGVEALFNGVERAYRPVILENLTNKQLFANSEAA